MALTDNLVAYWKCDESSGNAADATGNGRTAANTNVTYTTGKINNGLVFNGTSAKMVVSANSAFNFNDKITVAFWAKTTTTTYLQPTIFKGPGAEARYIWYPRASGGVLVEWHIGSSTSLNYSATGNTDWHHIVCTFDKDGGTNNKKIYYDGSQVAQQSDTTAINTGNYDIVFGNFSTEWFSGNMDEIGIWNRALSSTEVSALYNSGNGFSYPFSTTSIKSINGLGYSSIKSINGLAIGSMKNFNGLI